jgi:hypothetical protein
MSDEQLYGIAEREQSAGYSPMPLANPLPREEFDNTSAPAPDDPYRPISPSEAAQVLEQKRSQPDQQIADREATAEELPAVVRDYTRQGGAHSGEPMPSNEVVSAEQAAFDLAKVREQDAVAAKVAEETELQKVIDQLRAGDQQPQQPVAEPQQQQAQPEVPQPQAATADDEVQRALSSPKVLAAIEAHVGQYQQAAQQAQQQYENAVLENTKMALAGLVSNFQELAGVPADGLATAIQMIHRTSPERGKAISSYLQNVSSLLQNGAQVVERQRQAQEQQTQARVQQYATQMQERFNSAARDSDASFEEYRKAQGISDAQLKEIRAEALAGLRESMTEDQIAAAWNTDWTLRSFPAQRMLMESALYRLGKRGLAQKVAPRPVPPIQHPGGGRAEFADARDYSTRDLSNKLSHSGSIKDAAALLNARRATKR